MLRAWVSRFSTVMSKEVQSSQGMGMQRRSAPSVPLAS